MSPIRNGRICPATAGAPGGDRGGAEVSRRRTDPARSRKAGARLRLGADRKPRRAQTAQPPVQGQGAGGFGVAARSKGPKLRTEGVAHVERFRQAPRALDMSGNWGRGGDRRSAAEPSAALRHPRSLRHAPSWRPGWQCKGRELKSPTSSFRPIIVYNTVGEIKGSEKPDEFVVVGAHLDSWDLGTGTTDNGTGSSVVLETAGCFAKCGVKPKRTIDSSFSRVKKKACTARAIRHCSQGRDAQGEYGAVHDTGTGKVIGIGTQGFTACTPILQKELACLKKRRRDQRRWRERLRPSIVGRATIPNRYLASPSGK